MKQLDIEAVLENMPQVHAFVLAELDAIGCGHKDRIKLKAATEELFINISSYAYYPETGPATIRVETSENPLSVSISFIDRGEPFDPLAKPDARLSQPLRVREQGGLGIFMVKKTMDDMRYEYEDGQNILTITKEISTS